MVDKLSESSKKLREMVETAIDDHIITREEYDKIIHIATEDGYIDNHEKVLLQQLQEMIADGSVRFGIKK